MKKLLLPIAFMIALLLGCASPVRFIQTDDTYVIKPKPEGSKIVFKHEKINRHHQVIGVIEVVMGKGAHRPELDALMIKKAREIGADGVMLVDYDVDRTVYLNRHHAVVGRGPWRRHVVVSNPKTRVRKSATGIAVVFK